MIWPLRRPVVIPDELAGELLGLVLLGAQVKAARTGQVASSRMVDLLRDLHEAQARHATRRPAPGFAIETAGRAPSTLEREVSTAEAADLLGCSRVRVRELARSGAVIARRSGLRAWLIDRASLDRYRFGKG